MKMCPCKECEERKVGCHAKCEDYKEWKAEYEKAKERDNKSRHIEYGSIAYRTRW